VPAALHDRRDSGCRAKIDRSGDIGCGLRSNTLETRLARPRADPAESLRERRLVGEIIRVFQRSEERVGAGAVVLRTFDQRRMDIDEPILRRSAAQSGARFATARAGPKADMAAAAALD